MAAPLDPLTDKFASYVNEYDADQRTALSDTLKTARIYVAHALDGRGLSDLLMADCVIVCAADLWQSRDARNGVMAMGGDTFEPFRISTDPLRAVWPKLRAAGIMAGLGIA